MKLNAAPRILIVAAICTAALIGLVFSEDAARRGGLEVLLPMEAVDPRALLGGHYVQLNLMQRLEPGEQCPPNADAPKWVALRPDGDVYVTAGAAASRELVQRAGPVQARGRFDCYAPTQADAEAQAAPGWVRLDLGIDRFHVNQADAMRIEHILREQAPDQETRAFAIVSIGRDGRARLKGLVVDGERLELNWL